MGLSQNNNGDYALYSNGKLVGWSPITIIQGKKIVNKYVNPLNSLISAALKANIHLQIDSGFRTWDEQFAIRKANLIDKSKINDNTYIATANNGLFSPRTAMPGYSNHQDGDAIDFNVNLPGAYKWMVNNAIQYGWVRTVKDEEWHWQYLPSMGKFSFVPSDHPSWHGLV